MYGVRFLQTSAPTGGESVHRMRKRYSLIESQKWYEPVSPYQLWGARISTPFGRTKSSMFVFCLTHWTVKFVNETSPLIFIYIQTALGFYAIPWERRCRSHYIESGLRLMFHDGGATRARLSSVSALSISNRYRYDRCVAAKTER